LEWRFRFLSAASLSPRRDCHEYVMSPIGPGHNHGPPLESLHGYKSFTWRKAQRNAWQTPPVEVIRMRARRARELGMSYRAYTLEIMERGRYL